VIEGGDKAGPRSSASRVSEQSGVSPWHWGTTLQVVVRTSGFVAAGTRVADAPVGSTAASSSTRGAPSLDV